MLRAIARLTPLSLGGLARRTLYNDDAWKRTGLGRYTKPLNYPDEMTKHGLLTDHIEHMVNKKSVSDVFFRRIKDVTTDHKILPERSIIYAKRLRSGKESVIDLKKKNEVAACIRARDNFPEVDFVLPRRTAFKMHRFPSPHVRQYLIKFDEGEEDEILCTMQALSFHQIEGWPMKIYLQRFVVGAPNLIELPIIPINYSYKGNDLVEEQNFDSVWVWTYTDTYPSAIEVNVVNALTAADFSLENIENQLPPGMFLHEKHRFEIHDSVFDFMDTDSDDDPANFNGLYEDLDDYDGYQGSVEGETHVDLRKKPWPKFVQNRVRSDTVLTMPIKDVVLDAEDAGLMHEEPEEYDGLSADFDLDCEEILSMKKEDYDRMIESLIKNKDYYIKRSQRVFLQQHKLALRQAAKADKLAKAEAAAAAGKIEPKVAPTAVAQVAAPTAVPAQTAPEKEQKKPEPVSPPEFTPKVKPLPPLRFKQVSGIIVPLIEERKSKKKMPTIKMTSKVAKQSPVFNQMRDTYLSVAAAQRKITEIAKAREDASRQPGGSAAIEDENLDLMKMFKKASARLEKRPSGKESGAKAGAAKSAIIERMRERKKTKAGAADKKGVPDAKGKKEVKKEMKAAPKAEKAGKKPKSGASNAGAGDGAGPKAKKGKSKKSQEGGDK